MQFYTESHKYSGGVDLHAKSLYLCVSDGEGRKVVHRNIRNNADYLLKVLEPYREDVVVATECVFNWYWVADLCEREKIPFVLGHALYMKAIHGGKAKSDKIDSEKIARLLRSHMLPKAYVYPVEMRATRDLMRRRTYFVRKRAELFTHLQQTRIQQNLPDFPKRVQFKVNRQVLKDYFDSSFVQSSADANLAVIARLDEVIRKLDLEILRAAKVDNPQAFHLLRSVPGIGEVLALTILYEMHTVERFPRVQDFLSYCRLVKCQKESGGKILGTGCGKIGNAHLKWAFGEAAVSLLRNEPAAKYVKQLEAKHGKGKAMGILATKIARSVYTMLSKNRSFDMDKFFR